MKNDIELNIHALEIVSEMRKSNPQTFTTRVRCVKQLRTFIDEKYNVRLSLADAVDAIDRAIAQLESDDLAHALVAHAYGAWTYRFPNGFTVEVTVDMDCVAHFKTLAYVGTNDEGTARGGMTSDQVVAQLHYVKSLPPHVGLSTNEK